MKISFEFPQVGRKRLIGTGVLCSIATALWIFAAAQQSALAVLPLHVLVGVAIPFGVGWVTLLLMEQRIKRDDVRVRRTVQAERDREKVAVR